MDLDRKRDLAIVRELARRVAEACAAPHEALRRARWCAVNALRTPDRAPVWCRPARVWTEILPESALESRDPHCRRFEMALRQRLYKEWVGDDEIGPPYWPVSAVWRTEEEPLWGLPTGRLVATTAHGGWRLAPPIESDAHFDRVCVPRFGIDFEATERDAEQAAEVLGSSMPVRVVCSPPLDANAINTGIDQLRGMERFLLDLVDAPERAHRLLAKLLEGVLAGLRAAEASGMLTEEPCVPMTCSEPLRDRSPGEPVLLADRWTAANSQEFDPVSPAMFEEFLLAYQRPVLASFGAVQYGCCESLNGKLAHVRRLPNLRLLVCSPWTDLDRAIEAASGHAAVMWRQRAADVTLSSDLSRVERDLREGARKLRGVPHQIVLREIETLDGRPERLRDWAALAIRIAEDESG